MFSILIQVIPLLLLSILEFPVGAAAASSGSKCEIVDENIRGQDLRIYVCPELNISTTVVEKTGNTWIVISPAEKGKPVGLKNLPKLLLESSESLIDLYLQNLDLEPKATFTEMLKRLEVPLDQVQSVMVYGGSTFNLEQLKGLDQLWKLQISGVKFSEPLSGLKEFPELRQLALVGNLLKEAPSLEGLQNLQELKLQQNQILELPKRYFSDNQLLSKIIIIDNVLSSIPDDVFIPLQNIESLTLYTNSSSIPVLKGLQELREVIVQANPDAEVELGSGQFFNLTNIKTISLWNAGIESVAADAFVSNSRLTSIDLSSNKLTGIPKEVFRKNIRLQNVDLSYNEIEELSDTMFPNNLEALRVVANPIHKFNLGKQNYTSKLEELDITSGNLSGSMNLQSYSYVYPSLQFLVLARNQFTELKISPDIYFKDEIEVDLSYNQILNVLVEDHGSRKRSKQNRIKIDLEGNPLQCDCKMMSFMQSVQNVEKQGAGVNVRLMKDVKCEEPSGMTLLTIDLEKLKC